MWQEHPQTPPWQRSQEQQHSFAQPPLPAPPPGMVWPPMAANDRTNFGVTVIGLFLFPLILVPQGIANFVDSHLPFLLRLGALLFFYLPLCVLILLGIKAHKQSRRWNVVNQRRLIAAAFGFTPDVPLAQPQPVPNLGALPLNSMIKHKINWLPTCIWACLTACIPFFFLLWTLLSFTLFYGDPLQGVLHFWFVPLVWGIGVLVNYLVRSLPQRIEVTPEGLAVKHPGCDWASNHKWFKKQGIRWHETRLFAIRSSKRDGSTVRYELSGPTTVVTFDRILQPRWWLRFRSGQSFGEYNMQMDALLAFITAHTGLLLYDVRQHD